MLETPKTPSKKNNRRERPGKRRPPKGGEQEVQRDSEEGPGNRIGRGGKNPSRGLRGDKTSGKRQKSTISVDKAEREK